ncbi:MAG: hypothetical protein OEN23_18080 [Paracoccaceae bacterium]|nr:hypothetical protein [Paracoccaceae bacterium]
MSDDTGKQEQKDENKMIDAIEENMLEMRSAMYSMMSSCTKTMQAFVDMRMNYLKVMREGLDDPVTMMNIVSKNMSDTASALKEERRKETAKED